MYDIRKHLNALEFSNVLNMLAEEATLPSAKELALGILPFESLEEAKTELNKTEEAFMLSAKYANPSFGSVANPSPLLTRCEIGGVLSLSEFLEVASCLRIIRTVKEWREAISENAVTYLEEMFSALIPNKFLEDKINSVVKNNEELYDSASAKLLEIRREKVRVTAKIKDKLDSIVKNRQKNKYLQEAIVTQRDGRYVVPLKAEFRNEISGIVHDTSSSGSTLFVEPMAVVEANNEMRVLLSNEREEIDRILLELSGLISEFSEQIRNSFDMLSCLNLIFAKSNLAYKMKATVPVFDSSEKIVLKNARHPLIDKKKVVPISVSLGTDYNQLVITGPNTGGKTVALKTVGLMTVMAMCGLMIPADDGSIISFFERILVDIGDEQSIEQSLSTFSSHICNIVNILEESVNPCLVLLDELGAGTDPIEGAALAKAILCKLADNNAKVIATTHYPELKGYAIETNGVENASFEFNVDTLKPTYKLLLGIPGKSNAFAISSRLGISEDIIDAANNFLSERDKNFENIAASLEELRQKVEEEKEDVDAVKRELSFSLDKANKALEEAEAQKESILEKAKDDASYIIDSARYKSNALITELEDIKKKYTHDNATELFGSAKRLVKNTIDDLESLSDPVDEKKNDNYVLPRKLVIGDTVLVVSLNKQAKVEKISKDEKSVFVTVGAISTWTDVEDIKLIEAKAEKQITQTGRRITGVKSKVERDVRYEFDIRGMTVADGIMELDRYIDQAVLSGIPSVTIIHGKGTGALRKGVHDFLKRNKQVTYFRLGVFGEGEAGVTIAELKK